MISPQMWLNTTYKQTQGENTERGPARTDCEGTGEEPLDGAACNLGACMCSGYRGSSMAAIEIMKREIEREMEGSKREKVMEGESGEGEGQRWSERVERSGATTELQLS
jgi:hypothetical protein